MTEVQTSVVQENFTNEIKEETNSYFNGALKLTNGKIKNGKMKTGAKNADTHCKLPKEIGTDWEFKRKIVWFNAIGFLFLHIMALYGFFLLFSSHILTIGWTLLVGYATGEGVTIGAHRLWSHRTFKAHFIVQIALIILQTISGQNCLYIWVRDHRLHHKYSDTDADPHNANRGFFFSHMGWLMSKKHPAVINKGKTIDMSDLEADPVVMFQKTFYKPLYLIFAIIIPVAVPICFWGESYTNAFFVSYMFRYIATLHGTWLVNSAAHLYGTKPFDKNLKPVECLFVSVVTIGEGWHNYHHAFPWDYRASEFGAKFNFTTHIIDFLAWLGLVWDRREAPEHFVEYRAKNFGDGSHEVYGKMAKEEDLSNPINKEKIQQILLENKTKKRAFQ